MNAALRRALVLLTCVSLAARAACASAGPERVEQGRALYFGTQAFATPPRVGGAPLPADAAACVRCHGALGAGSREGARTAPAIARTATADPRAWIEAALAGQGRGGRRLETTMPRYTLTEREQDALAAYAPLLGSANDVVRGVVDTEIRVGVPLTTGQEGVAVTQLRAGIETAFARANAHGGVNGRMLRAVPVDAATAMVSVFALVGELGPIELNEPALAGARLPSLAALGLAREPVGLRSWVVPLLPDLREQAALLVRTLAARALELDCAAWLLDPAALSEAIEVERQGVRYHASLQAELVASRPARLCIGSLAPAAASVSLLEALRRDGAQVLAVVTLAALGPVSADSWQDAAWQVLPAPAAVMLHAHSTGVGLWSSLGEAAGQVVVEALARSGRLLQPEIVLATFRELTGYAPIDGAPLAFGRNRTHGWLPSLWAPANDAQMATGLPLPHPPQGDAK